ncbi:MAG: 30S ribosomal protein S18, partial [Candidatus Paceibacterota bacterium]
MNKNPNLKQCSFCTSGVKTIDYKDIETIKKYTDSYAKITKKRKTNVCATHQRRLAEATKRARFLSLVPYI